MINLPIFLNLVVPYSVFSTCVVQIRSLRDPYPLIQTVVLRNARHLGQSNNSVIVALDNSVYGLFPVPLGAQVLMLPG